MRDELGILSEVAHIAAGHGSTALSDFLGKRVILNPPHTDVISPERFPQSLNKSMVAITIFSRLRSGLKGEVLFILDEKNAFRIIGLSSMVENGQKNELPILTEMGLSIIKEIGNIIIGSYLTALSITLERMIVPPLATLISGSMEYIMDFIFSPYTGQCDRYFIETFLEIPEEKITGQLCLILSPDAFNDIKEICMGILGYSSER